MLAHYLHRMKQQHAGTLPLIQITDDPLSQNETGLKPLKKGHFTMINNLTNGMIRLSEEISVLRNNRAELTSDLLLGRANLGSTVSEMIAGFRQDRQEMGEKTKTEVGEFVSNLKGAVAGLRAEFASDITGAHTAWSGSAADGTPNQSGSEEPRGPHFKTKRKKR